MTAYIKSWKQREFLAKVSGIVADNLYRAAQYAADRAREAAPRATGRLVKAVDIVVETTARGNTIEAAVGVKKAVFYAWFVEMGTAHSAAHPFLRPAVFDNAAEIVRIVEGKG